MARGKKKEELTLEEKLERALVPVEEQPYEVPENWCWTYLKDVAQWGSGGTPSRKNPAFYEGNILWVKTSELQEDYIYDTEEKISKEAIQKSSAKIFPVGTVLIAMYGATIGKTAILGVKAATNQACACAVCNDSLYNKYLFYYLRFQKDSFIKQGKGGAQPNISQDIIKKNYIPLPPKVEQQRIVEQIESLFAKLDEAKEKVQEVIAQHGLRITAILHKAFLGDLSFEWRTMHGMMKKNWEVKRIKDVCKPRTGYAFDSKKFQNHGCQIVRMGNLYGGVLDLSRSPVFISEDELDEKMIERAKIKHGDILITLTGTKYKRDYGYAVCIENPENLYVNQRILCLTPNENINRDYLLYYLQSNAFRDIFFSNETGGVNQGNVSSKFVENIDIQIPSIEEQRVIVTELNNMLLKEAQTAELAGCVLQRIDLMKKSILAKAFRGELGTNNPDEESAIELLKTIIAET